jgi:hypothetical protein
LAGYRSGRRRGVVQDPAGDRDAEIAKLKVKVGDFVMTNELLEAKIEKLEGGCPLTRRRSRR